jgi:hypothetical protein
MYQGFGENNCFLLWVCPENMSVERSQDGGYLSSLINDIRVSNYTTSWFGRLNSSALLMNLNSDMYCHAKACRTFVCSMSVY